jgi:L-aspartate semialdehyde sulfurtransferase ferredoxin
MGVQEDRVVLHIPADKVTEPIISRIVKEYDVTVNILKAQIRENDEGLMVLGLQGTGTAIKAARKYLAGLGVRVEALKRDVAKSDTRCVHCGACVGQCPTGALYVTADFEVKLDPKKCVACGHCAVACSYAAVEVKFDE